MQRIHNKGNKEIGNRLQPIQDAAMRAIVVPRNSLLGNVKEDMKMCWTLKTFVLFCICIVFVFVLNVKEDMKTCKLDVEDIWGDITTNRKWMETETTTNRFLVMDPMLHLLPPLTISLEGKTMFMTSDCSGFSI